VDILPGEEPDESMYRVTKAYLEYDESRRPPMEATTLPHVHALPPRPDVTHPDSALLGVAKRMAYKPPPYCKHLRRRFRRFVKQWVRENLEPILESDALDFEEWLSETNYPDWRKKEIRDAYKSIEKDFDDKDVYGNNRYSEVKYFVKEENYPEYKHHRGIWARVDEFKAISGPFFRKIEEKLFKLPYFIKKIPKDKRPEYIQEMLFQEGMKYQTTDFTSFESLFTTDMMDDCEFELYRYMASKNPRAKWICQVIFAVVASDNHVTNKYFTLGVHAKRMSGEMNTSLGNGFSNLMFLLFACKEYKIYLRGAVVEGDDGLTSQSKEIPPEYFKKMGLNVKMKTVESLSEASFCGIIFDPIENINIRDPRVPLATCTWVSRKYATASEKKIRSLVRSKALSMIFEYPGCPILSKLGMKIFSLLEGYEIVNIGDSNYTKEVFEAYIVRYKTGELPVKEIGQRTRALMEKMFGISLSTQYMIERSIEEMTLEYWDTEHVLNIMPDVWINNYNNYVYRIEDTHCNINFRFDNLLVNQHKEKLFKLRKVSNTKSSIKKLLTYKEFISHKKFLGKTLIELLAAYKEYFRRYKDSQNRLFLNARPIT